MDDLFDGPGPARPEGDEADVARAATGGGVLMWSLRY